MHIQGFSGHIGYLIPLYNEKGYPLYKKFLWYRIPLFEYQCTNPQLVYTDEIGVQYQLDRHFQTDGGTIPPLVRLMPGAHLDPFNFIRSYLYHDCICLFGGLYIKYPHDSVFKFRLIKRERSNIFLENMLPFDQATPYDVSVITKAVTTASPFVWTDKKTKHQREQRRLSRINVYNTNGDLIEYNP